jgi:DHA3 family tetracycline resistance protein-like MFS transporter
VISMSSQVDALGQIAGGPIVGVIGNTFGVRAALASSAAILSPVLLLLVRTVRKDGRVPIVEVEPVSID